MLSDCQRWPPKDFWKSQRSEEWKKTRWLWTRWGQVEDLPVSISRLLKARARERWSICLERCCLKVLSTTEFSPTRWPPWPRRTIVSRCSSTATNGKLDATAEPSHVYQSNGNEHGQPNDGWSSTANAEHGHADATSTAAVALAAAKGSTKASKGWPYL